MTKVLRGIAATVVLFLAIPGLVTASNAQSVVATHQPGPGESLYLELGNIGLDPARVFAVRDASIDRSAIHITLNDGTIAFTKDVLGKITGAFFVGDGEVLLSPPDDVERRSMSRFTGMAILEEQFSTAYFRFNDDTAAELQPGLRAPEQAQDFAARWDQTARNLAHEDAMRLLSTFCELLPDEAANGTASKKQTDPEDRLFHARLQGNSLGIFDLFFDSTADEQIEAGQSRTADNGKIYYDVWTSFSTQNEPRKVLQKKIPETLPEQSESRQNRILIHSYVIDAQVKPPKELDASVKVQLDAEHGGSRFLIFELSRSLHVESVEADGRPVEFIHNPAVEGSRLARSGDDLVAVILPAPAVKGQQISLRFVYSGDVLAEAGNGLLYVGERGTWYPNRGLAMADFDLTFHYPRGWTLVATGKPTAVSPIPSISAQGSQPANEEAEQVGRWVSERPIPVAGFNLGKYVRAEAKAGNVNVDAYATREVERDFPAKNALPPTSSDGFQRRPGVLLPPASPAAPPSPAGNERAVAEFTAGAIDYYADRFGPFPYSQLDLTQLPGRESQGWPGLIFLSSYAFLSKEEQEAIHGDAASVLIDELVPAHEAAHQWWGDLVTWSTYRDQWFSEGLANYSALMMLEEKNPAGFRLVMEKYREMLLANNEDAGPVTLGSRLLSSRFPNGYEAITYGRATWLFHMLRTMLQDGAVTDAEKSSEGDAREPFVQSLHKLRDRYQGKSITTRELLEVFAEDLPRSLRYEGRASLDWFLDGWVNGTSLPKLELQGVKFSGKGKNTLVSGVIRQTDAPDDLVTSVPLYAAVPGRPPVLLRRVFADGVETAFHLTAPVGTRKLLLDPYITVLTSSRSAK